jgi:PAS domain S-box-containing protein
MFESTAAGVYQATTDDRMISANPAFVALLGYANEEEVLQLDFGSQIAMNHEDHLLWRRELEADGEIRSREATLRSNRGERVVVLHSARLVRDSRGVPLYYEGTVADITAAHRQARQWSYEASHDALTSLLNRRELERRLQGAFENATIDRSTLALVMVDLDEFKRSTTGSVTQPEMICCATWVEFCAARRAPAISSRVSVVMSSSSCSSTVPKRTQTAWLKPF